MATPQFTMEEKIDRKDIASIKISYNNIVRA